MKKAFKRMSKTRLVVILNALLLSVTLLLSYTYYKMRPVIMRYAVSVAETIMLDSANQAVIDILSGQNISYRDIVSLSRNEAGEVRSLETDIKQINLLKSMISLRVSELIEQNEFYSVKIPVGTFLLNHITAGIGPKVPMRMQLTSTAKVDFGHEFKAAGINQVSHLVIIHLEISGSLVIAGFSESITVSTSAIAAQTVIVGAVPDAFTNVVENENDATAGLINDYGAVAGK